MSKSFISSTTTNEIANTLRREIHNRTILPGARLPQNHLAERFSVSATPVREALRLLEAEGLVRIGPHKGAVVFEPTVGDMIEAFEIRITLEQLAIGRAITLIPDDAIDELQGIGDLMRQTTDPGEWRSLNRQFHLKLNSYAGRPRLARLIQRYMDETSGYSQIAILGSSRGWWADDEHDTLIEACRSRDSEAGKRIIAEHLSSTVARLLHEDSDMRRE